MKHDLKSDLDKLTNRGMALDDDINMLKNYSLEKLIDYLNNESLHLHSLLQFVIAYELLLLFLQEYRN